QNQAMVRSFTFPSWVWIEYDYRVSRLHLSCVCLYASDRSDLRITQRHFSREYHRRFQSGLVLRNFYESYFFIHRGHIDNSERTQTTISEHLRPSSSLYLSVLAVSRFY
ncbi:hypothetical protein PENTCL1PPCAC_20350, partial [Pristionchus entomophagus]